MKLIIYTCECLLDHLIRMTEDEIEKYIVNHVMFSLSDIWLMYIHLPYINCLEILTIKLKNYLVKVKKKE